MNTHTELSNSPAATELPVTRNTHPVPAEQRKAILADPGFGKWFTDHMVMATWTRGQGWHDAGVVPYGPIPIQPSAAVLHYAQEIFEGLKVYKRADGSVWSFRADANAARMARSAQRLALPEVPADMFLGAIASLVRADRAWVPTGGESSLYIRPFMFASEAFLGVRPADDVIFCVIASPAGAYFPGGVKPVSLWLSQEYARAAPGGTGAAKCGGNYAASLAPMVEAADHGCEQVVFLDAVQRRYVEELGGMNIFFVFDDGSVLTPALSGTILEGVTRDAILTLLRDQGRAIDERPIDIAQWRDGVASGRLQEVFACGTAAVVTPVGRLVEPGAEHVVGGGEVGPVTSELREALTAIQYGTAADPYGWTQRLA